MPYIKQVSDEEATGAVKRELDKAYKRAGRVWNIVRIMTPQRRGYAHFYELLHRPDVRRLTADTGAARDAGSRH